MNDEHLLRLYHQAASAPLLGVDGERRAFRRLVALRRRIHQELGASLPVARQLLEIARQATSQDVLTIVTTRAKGNSRLRAFVAGAAALLDASTNFQMRLQTAQVEETSRSARRRLVMSRRAVIRATEKLRLRRETREQLLDKLELPPNVRRRLEDLRRRELELRNRVAEANLRLVVMVAKSFVGTHLTMLDLIQEGNLGLLKAIEEFDPGRGLKFSTYACAAIRRNLGRALDNLERTVRRPIHIQQAARRINAVAIERLPAAELSERTGLPLRLVEPALRVLPDVPVLDPSLLQVLDPTSPEGICRDKERRAVLEAALARLKPREREILEARFGMKGEPRTLEEIARARSLTKERIRQIEAVALKKLRVQPGLREAA